MSYSSTEGADLKYMYLARVLVGEYAKGQPGLKTPPKRHGFSTEMYDSTVNNLSNPSIFVIYHDSQSYPEYLLEFL